MVFNEITLSKKYIMKNIFKIILFVCTAGTIWSCEREIDLVNKVSTTEGSAFVKFVHASPNFRQVYKGADSFNVYMNNTKISGSFLTYGLLYPTATNLYAAVPPGAQAIRLTVNGVLTPDSITLAATNKSLEAGSYYSFIITDEAAGTNESRQMWLKDNFALTDTSNFTIRFVHAVLNDPGAVDVYSFRRASNIFTNISPAKATAFLSLPYDLATDTFYVRPTGTLTDIAKLTVSTGSPGANTTNRGRAHTLLYRGHFGVTTGTKARSLTIFANN